MKTILILILTLALLAAALMTRPDKREFVLYLLDRQTGSDGAWTRSSIEQAENLSKTVTLRNRFLWTDVEKDGQVIYTGLFAHFIPHSFNTDKVLPNVKELAKLVNQ
jgi:hypothetical protein